MRKNKRTVIRNEFLTPKVAQETRFALVADLHDGPFEDLLPELYASDAVLICGDLVDRHRDGYNEALAFLREVTGKVPTFYAIGNHERRLPSREAYMKEAMRTDAIFLDDRCETFRGMKLGGLSSKAGGQADTAFLDRFAAEDGYRLLLCHHPEIWDRYVQDKDIDLTLCGHAHGGQIQIAGHGLFAPGQGLFPRYTGGLYGDGRMLLSRGLTNNTVAPRINTPCELHIVTVKPDVL